MRKRLRSFPSLLEQDCDITIEILNRGEGDVSSVIAAGITDMSLLNRKDWLGRKLNVGRVFYYQGHAKGGFIKSGIQLCEGCSEGPRWHDTRDVCKIVLRDMRYLLRQCVAAVKCL